MSSTQSVNKKEITRDDLQQMFREYGNHMNVEALMERWVKENCEYELVYKCILNNGVVYKYGRNGTISDRNTTAGEAIKMVQDEVVIYSSVFYHTTEHYSVTD